MAALRFSKVMDVQGCAVFDADAKVVRDGADLAAEVFPQHSWWNHQPDRPTHIENRGPS